MYDAVAVFEQHAGDEAIPITTREKLMLLEIGAQWLEAAAPESAATHVDNLQSVTKTTLLGQRRIMPHDLQ
jgi:hypothetical protein